jgi:hypothetical protein
MNVCVITAHQLVAAQVPSLLLNWNQISSFLIQEELVDVGVAVLLMLVLGRVRITPGLNRKKRRDALNTMVIFIFDNSSNIFIYINKKKN